jgi:hypothetical protein
MRTMEAKLQRPTVLPAQVSIHLLPVLLLQLTYLRLRLYCQFVCRGHYG